MPAKHSRHIALTASLAEWIDQQVVQGEYSSTSDLIRTAVRVLRERDEAVRARSSMANHHAQPAQPRV